METPPPPFPCGLFDHVWQTQAVTHQFREERPQKVNKTQRQRNEEKLEDEAHAK